MSPLDREAMKERAAAKLAAMRERSGGLRRRALILAAGLFAMVWVAIFVQGLTGNDPALGTASSSRTAAEEGFATDSDAYSEEGGDDDDEGDDEDHEGEEGWFSPVEEALAPVKEVVVGVERVVEGSSAGYEELESVTSGQS